jgi:hypothetical protein
MNRSASSAPAHDERVTLPRLPIAVRRFRLVAHRSWRLYDLPPRRVIVEMNRVEVSRLIVAVVHRMWIAVFCGNDEFSRPPVFERQGDGGTPVAIRVQKRSVLGALNSVALLH